MYQRICEFRKRSLRHPLDHPLHVVEFQIRRVTHRPRWCVTPLWHGVLAARCPSGTVSMWHHATLPHKGMNFIQTT